MDSVSILVLVAKKNQTIVLYVDMNLVKEIMLLNVIANRDIINLYLNILVKYANISVPNVIIRLIIVYNVKLVFKELWLYPSVVVILDIFKLLIKMIVSSVFIHVVPAKMSLQTV